MKRFLPLVLLAAGCSTMSLRAATDTIPLDGTWHFRLDRTDAGLQENWAEKKLSERIHLPGSLTEYNMGDDVTTNTSWTGEIMDKSWFTAPEFAKYRQPGNVKLPFWLTPQKYFAGAAWYQREFKIPDDWNGRRVVLTLERPHWETRVWVDGKIYGTNDSLGTPHEYDLGLLAPGRHALTIRVDNRRMVDIGENSHSISDQTQGNWNGLAGDLLLRATPPVWIEDLQVYPRLTNRSVTVTGKIGNVTGQPGKSGLLFYVNGKLLQSIVADWTADGGQFSAEILLGKDAPLWDEFHPDVMKLLAKLDDAESTATFGLREISTEGTQFTINGNKTFFRGTVECCVFPATGYPPTDVASWKRIISTAKSFGLNLMRFHSWCPPEAAFEAADELGFYLHVEAGVQGATLGDGKPVDAWIDTETRRIVNAYGNHPSFVLMTCGDEPQGSSQERFLTGYVDQFKRLDERRLWTGAIGRPQLVASQFQVTSVPHMQTGTSGLAGRINARPPSTMTDYRDVIGQRDVPVISDEAGQWSVYPDLAATRKYSGGLKPGNLEIISDSLAGRYPGSPAKQFLFASGKLQTLCYKEEIEALLRTPGMGGFELFGLTDYPGRGTAPVGVLDAFWDNKGYVSTNEFSRFCNAVVPLARLEKRVFTTNETLAAEIDVVNFGGRPLTNVTPFCKLMSDDGRVVASQIFARRSLAQGTGFTLGRVNFGLNDVPAPAHYKLVAGISGTEIRNDWDVWVYPTHPEPKHPRDIAVFQELNDAALAVLGAGGTVLWLVPPEKIRNDDALPVKFGFSTIFWNTAWTHRQSPTTLGILCDAKSPLFAEFPTEDFSNWQWWYLTRHAQPMILDALPRNLQPAVRVIDDWATNRKLALAFEARAGNGKLFVCSVDLDHEMDNDPVRRQFRVSLLDYLASKDFQPKVEVPLSALQTLVKGAAR